MAEARGSLDSRSCSRIGLDCSGRKVHGCPRLAKAGEADCSSRPQAPRPAGPIAFGETMANAGSAHPLTERLVLLRRVRDRGVRSRFTPLPTADNAADEGALPGRALDQGPSQDRAEHAPRETRVTRDPAEALAASSSAASTDGSRRSNDPQGARVRESVADVEMTHLPSGRGLPKGRQPPAG